MEGRPANYTILKKRYGFSVHDAPLEVISHFLCKMAFAFYTTPDEWNTFAKSEATVLQEKVKENLTYAKKYFS